MNQDQDDLRQRFRELRKLDRGQAPEFEELIRGRTTAAPAAPHQGVKWRRPLVLAGAACLLAALWLRPADRALRTAHAEPTFDEACAAALAALELGSDEELLHMSTDDLLPLDPLSDR